jgi:hypothetical protein
MSTVYSLMPLPKIQFLDSNGNPLSGGYIYTYYTGTQVPKTTYANAQGTAYNTDPVVLDSQGRASVWLDGVYDVEVWTGDKYSGTSTLVMTQQTVGAVSQPVTIDTSTIFTGLTHITVGPTAPTSPTEGDLWVDTSV